MTVSPDESPATMLGLVQQSLDGVGALRAIDDLPTPDVGADEYLVAVEAAGLNFADVLQSEGRYGDGPQPPYVAGFEAAGVIVAVGAQVSDPLPIGTRVLGTGPGAFAELMVMPASTISLVPQGWTAEESLGLVLNWATALAALRPLGRLAPGEWVLIHAAAGGVGQAAVRLARHYGGRVVASAATAKHGVLSDLGADVVVDRSSPQLRSQILEATGGVDLVLESVGRATFADSLALTRPVTGRVVVLGAASGEASIDTHGLVYTHPVHIIGLHIGTFAERAPALYRELMDEIGALIEIGVIAPGTPQVHALREGPEAMRSLAEGATVGKVALSPLID